MVTTDIIGVVEVCLPTVNATVAGVEGGDGIGGGGGHGGGQTAFPFIGRATVGKAAIVALKIGAVNGGGNSSHGASEQSFWLTDANAPACEGSAIGIVDIIVQIECPDTTRIFAIKPP